MRNAQKKEVSSSLSNIVKSSAIVFIGLAISKILTYVYRVIAARYFGPETYGLFSLAIVISSWVVAIATLGLTDGLLRYIAINRSSKKGEANYLFSYSTKFLAFTSIIGGLLLFVGAEQIATGIFHESNLIIFLKIFSIAVPLTVISTPLLMSIRAFEKISAYSFIFNILQSAVKVLLLFALILFGLGEQSLSWSYLAGLAIVLLASYYYARKNISQIFIKNTMEIEEKKKMRNELLKYSWPLLFYGILASVMYWIDSFSIGYFKDATAVGWYNAAVPIALLLTFAPEIFIQLFYPMINRYYSEKKTKIIQELSKQVAKWIFVINLPLFAVMLIFPKVLINVLFGPEYIIAAGALQILAFSSLISSFGHVSMNLIGMIGKSKLVMYNMIIAASLNLVLNWIFIPMEKIGFIDNSLGINGAALATVISLTIFNGLFMLQAYRSMGIFPLRRKMFNITLALLPSVLILYYVRYVIDNPSIFILGVAAIVFVILYAVLLLLFNSFDKYDWEIARKAFRKILNRN